MSQPIPTDLHEAAQRARVALYGEWCIVDKVVDLRLREAVTALTNLVNETAPTPQKGRDPC